jgi:hypothetical protein
MSDFESAANPESLAEGNPMVDRGQLDEAHELVEKLRRSGLTPAPAYRIDSPYERGPVEQPRSIGEGDEGGQPFHIR